MNISYLFSIRTEFTVLIVTLFLSILFVFISFTHLNSIHQHYRQLQDELFNTKQRYYLAVQQDKQLKAYSDQVSTFQKQNIIGKENRFSWLDEIERIKKTYHIPEIKYDISRKNELLLPDISHHYPDVRLFISHITLHMQLLHEGDLFTILHSLDKANIGLFNITKCTLSLNKELAGEKLFSLYSKQNVSSVCELDWYTLQLNPPS